MFGLPEDSSSPSINSYRIPADSALRAQNAELLERVSGLESQRAQDEARYEEQQARLQAMEEQMARMREMEDRMNEFFRNR